MITLDDYKDPFEAILDFESALAKFTGAPYVVTTDCCTHAMEIALRLRRPDKVTFPAYTYLSVVMLMHKLNIPYTLTDTQWRGEYLLKGSSVWDSARLLEPMMFRPGQIQCLSFGISKPLFIGRGGCLLTDDLEIYKRASCMRSDGRDLFSHKKWINQKYFQVGYHYNLRPEYCVQGLNLLKSNSFVPQTDELYNYPDCRDLVIND